MYVVWDVSEFGGLFVCGALCYLKCTFVAVENQFKVTAHLKDVEMDGEHYWQLVNSTYRQEPQRAYLKLANLFNGNQVLGKSTKTTTLCIYIYTVGKKKYLHTQYFLVISKNMGIIFTNLAGT